MSYNNIANEVAKRMGEENNVRVLEARRHLKKGIFIKESVKLLHNMGELEERIGCYDNYKYEDDILNYVIKNKNCLGYAEIEKMFYSMIAYTFGDVNREETISRMCSYYNLAIKIMGNATGERIEKDMSHFIDIFRVNEEGVGQHDIYDWFDNLFHLLIVARKMCECIVEEYEGV